MSRVLQFPRGAGGDFVEGDKFLLDRDGIPLRWFLQLAALGMFCREKFLGGTLDELPFSGDASGNFLLPNPVEFNLDNLNDQFSNFNDPDGATLICQITYKIRVSDPAINVIPRITYGASFGTVTTSVGTLTGATACSAINADFSGANQRQVLPLVLPSGNKWFQAGFTIAGTPAVGLQAWIRAYLDFYVQS